MGNFFKSFARKDDGSLLKLYREQVETVEYAASLLDRFVKADALQSREELCREIKKCESKGDWIADEIFESLYKARHTFINREYLQTLASHIESFMDGIHDCAKKMLIYHPIAIDKIWVEIVESILEDAKIISGLINEFSAIKEKTKFLMQKCLRIKEIEHEVDDMYECYMSNLFQIEKNAIELIKNKNIIQHLEDTTDRAKDISDCFKTIIVKS